MLPTASIADVLEAINQQRNSPIVTLEIISHIFKTQILDYAISMLSNADQLKNGQPRVGFAFAAVHLSAFERDKYQLNAENCWVYCSNPVKWERPFHFFALKKAVQSAATNLTSLTLINEQPHLACYGDIVYGGGIPWGDFGFAISGFTETVDALIATRAIKACEKYAASVVEANKAKGNIFLAQV